MPHLLLHGHNFVARICDIGFLWLLFFISKKSVILKLQMTIFQCKSQFHCHKLYGIFPYANLGVTTSTNFDLMEPNCYMSYDCDISTTTSTLDVIFPLQDDLFLFSDGLHVLFLLGASTTTSRTLSSTVHSLRFPIGNIVC